ncbi:MAG: hypothetical protein JXM71_01675, partial [Spirochaetales bacterium]|nr:hypothetical protein [Spirochaetales bacterium]
MMLSLLSLVAAALLAGLSLLSAICGWSRREVRNFVAMVVFGAAWLMASSLERLASSFYAKLAWDALSWPLAMSMAAFTVIFAHFYARPSARVSVTTRMILLSPVVMASAAAIAALAGFEAFLYYSLTSLVDLPGSELGSVPSPLALVLVVYSAVLAIWACGIVARGGSKKNAAPRTVDLFVLAGLSLPLVGLMVATAGFWPAGYEGMALVCFPVGAAMLAYGLFSQRLSGSLTMARRAVMDTLLDPVFVLGDDNKVVDCNAAARTLVATHTSEPIGANASELFASWPSSVNAALDFPEAETEIDLPDRDGIPRRSYRITVASNAVRDRTVGWKLLVFNDVTGQKTDARDLAASNEELEFWVKQRTT